MPPLLPSATPPAASSASSSSSAQRPSLRSSLPSSRSFIMHSRNHSRTSSPAAKLGAHAAGLMLRTHVIKARNLAPKDRNGLSDPYLVLTLGDARSSTVTIPKTLNPEWNEQIELPVAGAHSLLLEVICWDKDRFNKDYMGEFDVPLEHAFLSGTVTTEPTWYRLESRRNGRKKSVVTGEVLLAFSLFDPVHTSATPQQILQKLTGIVGETPSEEQDEPRVGVLRTDSAEQDDEPFSEEDAERLDEDEDDLNVSETQQGRTKRKRIARLRRRAKEAAYEFSGLSDVAGVLFVEVNRVTDLPPEKNLTGTSFDMDPFVVTSLGKKTFKTKVVRHNLNPVYDEKLVFQVLRHETSYSLNFVVMDRDKFSNNDFIGAVDLPLQKISALAPAADPQTGLYAIPDPDMGNSGPEERKRRTFRLPLSRSSSSNNVARQGRPPNEKIASTTSIKSQQSLQPDLTTVATSGGLPETTTLPVVATETDAEDPYFGSFALPLSLKNKDRWESKHKPTLHLRAKYLPYKALRQQFWRAMLKQYDADDSGSLSKVELTTMLDTLGSTLHESTIDSFFTRFNSTRDQGEPALTYDEAVICLEDALQSLEGQKKRLWNAALPDRIKPSSPPSLRTDPSAENSDTDGLYTPSESAAAVRDPEKLSHAIHGSRGEEGETIEANDLAEEGEEEHVVEIRECPICHLPRLAKRSDADIITHVATCASQDWRQVNNIVMAGFVTSSQAQRKWYSKVITKIGYGGYKLGANSANILVQDRITGQINEERMSVYVRLGIRLLYKGLKSREMEKKRIRRLLRSLSFKQGRKYDDPASAAEIPSFINFHQLDMSEVLRPISDFKNFNDFFYRELKPDARPCSAPDRPEVVTSPADCRTVVFNKISDAQTIWVKGREFSVERLLGDAYPEDAKRYAGGALGVFRLAPQDYHRFHIPVDGVLAGQKIIQGEYYTVNPMAIRSALDVYGENIRVLCPIDSERHGRVMVVCVGAMMVGSTVITRQTGDRVKRAEELGYFKFGGSTILLLFEPGQVEFDEDLVDNSNGALETLVRVGMSIGRTVGGAPHEPDMQKAASAVSPTERADAKRRIEGSLAPNMSSSLATRLQ